VRVLIAEDDPVGRRSDDELLVILPGCDPEKALSVAERLRAVTKLTVQPLEAATLQSK